MQRFILMLVLLSLPVVISQSQETSDTGWEIIERCVGDPITPPDGWTFDGTILATGWVGIHGINADWDTPRVQLFRDDWALFQELSPSDRWLATTRSEFACPQCFSRVWRISEIRVFDTLNGDEYIIPIDVGYDYGISYQTRIQMRWWDDDEIVFFTNGSSVYGRPIQSQRINPFTNERSIIELPIYPLTNDFDFHPSLNWELAVYNPIELPEEGQWSVYNLETGDGLLQLSSIVGSPHPTDVVAWSNASSQFITTTVSENSKFITYYNHLSESITNIYPIAFDDTPNHIEWSHDGRYVAFVKSKLFAGGELILIDTEHQIIYETCIETGSVHWSPVANQLALLSRNGQSSIEIYQPEANVVYGTGIYHEGRIIGWREDS
ncbi:MAG: hypothetical protein AAF846_03215 [Chloroflexota bacterium]